MFVDVDFALVYRRLSPNLIKSGSSTDCTVGSRLKPATNVR